MTIRVERVEGVSNIEFLKRYARMGRVALAGGTDVRDRAVRVGQKPLCPGGKASLWSHVVLFEGERIDGHSWLLESDLEWGRNGVQESRIDKYAKEKDWPNLAVLDFGATDEQARRMVAAGLDLLARRTPYALGGVLKTYWAMLRKTLDKDEKNDAVFCSAFVRVVCQDAGLDLAPKIAVRHTTPEHIAQTPLPHTRWELIREPS